METLWNTILPSGLAETCPPRQFPVSSFFKVSPFRRGILRTQENPYVLRLSVCHSDALKCSPRLRALAGDVSGNSEGGDEAVGRGSGFLPAEGGPLIEVLLSSRFDFLVLYNTFVPSWFSCEVTINRILTPIPKNSICFWHLFW